MYNISFVNPNFQVGPRELNAYFLPYSTGMIWSYAQSFTDIKSKFQVTDWIWRRDSIADTVKILVKSNIVGFSTYIWNKKYNYRLAQEVKAANPNCLIVFGGPEPPITDKNFFEKFPYIDVVIKQEGELSFKAILDNFEVAHYTSIPGLLVNLDGQTVDTGDSIRMSDLDSIPSPYLTGVFDQLMASHPDVKWNAILESNRGCPYQCTFCDWGSLTYQKVKKFNLQRVLDELEWLGKNKIGFISVADANFGMFPERDNVIADKLIEIQETYGWPTSYTLSYAKNQRAEVIDICHKLVTHGSRVGLTVGVQSMNEGVLEIIKRKNLKMNEVKIVFDECDRRDIPVFTELIIGLPGETLQSWRENFWRLFRLNNHTGITVYSAMLLENSEMTLGQKTLYGLESVEVKDYLVGSDDKDDIIETVQLIKCTRTMPFDDIIQGFLLTWFLNTTHINGLTNFLARFAYAYAGIDYEKFYNDLEQFLAQDPWWIQQKRDTESYYRYWLTHGSVDHPPIGTTPVYGTNLMLRTSIAIHEQNQYQHIYSLIQSYYQTNFSSHDPYINDLFAVQKSYFINYNDLQFYPKKVVTNNDILGFIQYGAELDSPAEYEFDWPEDATMSRQRFCENLWYARRRNFGKATIRYC